MSVNAKCPVGTSRRLIISPVVPPAQIRHSHKPQLDLLKDMPILLELKLSSSISLETASSRLDTLVSGTKFSTKTVKPGRMVPIYVNALADDKLVRSH